MTFHWRIGNEFVWCIILCGVHLLIFKMIVLILNYFALFYYLDKNQLKQLSKLVRIIYIIDIYV